jgi:hypothetical protein
MVVVVLLVGWYQELVSKIGKVIGHRSLVIGEEAAKHISYQ